MLQTVSRFGRSAITSEHKVIGNLGCEKVYCSKSQPLIPRLFRKEDVFMTDIREKNNQYSTINDFTLLEKSVSFFFLFFFSFEKAIFSDGGVGGLRTTA